MILTTAVLLGLLSGLTRAAAGGRKIIVLPLQHLWIVAVAYIPQTLAFSIPATRERIPDPVASIILIGSMALLLTFVIFNIKLPGIWALGLGLVLNLVVILLNGGFMPISPDTLHRRSPQVPIEQWQVGERLGTGKDIVLLESDTRLRWLSDRFVTPDAFPYHVAFSVGDIFIAIGAFLLLWAMGAPPVHSSLTSS